MSAYVAAPSGGLFFSCARSQARAVARHCRIAHHRLHPATDNGLENRGKRDGLNHFTKDRKYPEMAFRITAIHMGVQYFCSCIYVLIPTLPPERVG